MDAKDWRFWTGRPAVHVWQAVLLSLGKDPRALTINSPSFGETFRDGTEAMKHAHDLADSLGNREFFSERLQGRPWGGSLCWDVSLSEFAAWAKDVAGWDIPEELNAVSAAPNMEPAPAHPSKKETPDERARRIYDRCKQLKSEGKKDFLKQVAKEEGVGVSRIKAIRKKVESPKGKPRAGTIEALKLFGSK